MMPDGLRRSQRSKSARRWTLGSTLLLTLAVGCFGYAWRPTAITDTTATLLGLANCDASTTSNPCTAWFQYWQDGSATTPQETSHFVGNVNTHTAKPNGFPFNQVITGLNAGTLYHYQFCGVGD